MILTEEQRAAIHAVSGLLTAIGCPRCHSYLQKNYTHHIEVLRAMTDSSEHFSDATKLIGFDLERAREAIEEAVDRLSQKIGDEDGPIWEKEPEKAAVLQTLPDEIAHLEKWMIKNRDAATELQYQLDDAIKENERLRSAIRTYREREESAFSEIEMKDEFLTRPNARINELEADLEQSERVIEARLDVIDQRAARIKELEADNQNLVTLNKSLMNNDWILRDNNRKYRKRAQKAELLNKELKSKIGPDADAKPHCWQITEERKAAIMETIDLLNGDLFRSPYSDVLAVLRGMLEEVA